MRKTRRLLLFAIVIILGGVGAAYYLQKRWQAGHAPATPPSLPLNSEAAASEWSWSKIENGRTVVEIRAKDFRQLKDPPRIEIQRVDLRLFHKDGKRFDQVRCASARFDSSSEALYSDGDVEITASVPVEPASGGRLVRIRTSGVTFEKSGRATTRRPAQFDFDRGEGRAVGASYDPGARTLELHSQVELTLRGTDAGRPPMKLEAGQVVFQERESRFVLSPWARLTRGGAVLESAGAIVDIKNSRLQHVEAQQARGNDAYPGRRLEYSAGQLTMEFDSGGQLEKMFGERGAWLRSLSASTRTTLKTDRLELNFDPKSGENVLKRALATGHSDMEAAPVAGAAAPPPETRVLRGEVIELTMRAGGQEIENVSTHTPGTLEFLPNRPGQRHRRMDGERMWIAYGAENRIRSFRAVQVRTLTEPEPARGAKKSEQAPIQTWSHDLLADFDPKTGHLTQLQQWEKFRYQEGARQAQAEEASLDEGRRMVSLRKAARVWDAAGSTAADQILLDQSSGDIAASGHVTSSRLPDRKGTSSAMMSQDEPLEGQAQRMTTASHNQKVHYEGDVLLWQGASRIRAAMVDIDRTERKLQASGGVRTQFMDQKAEKTSGPVRFVTLESAALAYSDKDRVARYTGGARLLRAGMEVKAAAITVFLNDAKAESSLEKAYADGGVALRHAEPGHLRQGWAEHGEYYADDEKMILRGGQPRFEDSRHGSARGRELTYYANDDKLHVIGEAGQPAVSLLNRK